MIADLKEERLPGFPTKKAKRQKILSEKKEKKIKRGLISYPMKAQSF